MKICLKKLEDAKSTGCNYQSTWKKVWNWASVCYKRKTNNGKKRLSFWPQQTTGLPNEEFLWRVIQTFRWLFSRTSTMLSSRLAAPHGDRGCSYSNKGWCRWHHSVSNYGTGTVSYCMEYPISYYYCSTTSHKKQFFSGSFVENSHPRQKLVKSEVAFDNFLLSKTWNIYIRLPISISVRCTDVAKNIMTSAFHKGASIDGQDALFEVFYPPVSHLVEMVPWQPANGQ